MEIKIKIKTEIWSYFVFTYFEPTDYKIENGETILIYTTEDLRQYLDIDLKKRYIRTFIKTRLSEYNSEVKEITYFEYYEDNVLTYIYLNGEIKTNVRL